MQATHAPCPSQMVLVPQLLPAVTLGLLAVPAVQTSCVHGLLSKGRSRSSLTIIVDPCPLQTVFLQSFCVWPAISVPAARLVTPHWPETQLRVWQSASVPGQVLAVRHSTQWEAPSQTRLPPQVVPDWTLRWVTVPELHSSVVQGLVSTGRSPSSLTLWELPLPSHWKPLQSSGDVSTSFVPAAVYENPQTPPAVQVRVRHGPSEPGQSVATAHPTH